MALIKGWELQRHAMGLPFDNYIQVLEQQICETGLQVCSPLCTLPGIQALDKYVITRLASLLF